MDIERIISELTHYERLPVDAMRAASAERAALVPRFVEAFERSSDGDRGRKIADFLFLAFHLLGEWRETSAYRPLVRFLRGPSEHVDRVLSDSITETSHRVMAAVFDGDPQPLYDLILDAGAYEYVRARMCDVLAMLAVRGDMPREEVARFLRACFTDLMPQQNCFVWEGWQGAIAMLGLEELKPLVREAFDRGSVETEWMRFSDFEEDLAFALEHPAAPHRRFNSEYALWGDTVAELSTWSAFDEKEIEKRKRWAREPINWRWSPQETAGKVGRSDPCPCGSGQKFKKCCLVSESDWQNALSAS